MRAVEGTVLETMLEEIFDLPSTGVVAVDPVTRFYVLWRFTYGAVALDAGEAFVFCYPQNIELDESSGIVGSAPALVEKLASNVRVRTFAERGNDEALGLPRNGQPPPVIDVLHRTLWLMDNAPGELPDYLRAARPNREQLRLVAQALSGPVLTARQSVEDGLADEMSSLHKLNANWRAIAEDHTALRPSAELIDSGTLSLFGDD